MTDEELVEQLKRQEGWKRTLYKDHLGFWTIGCGRLVDPRRGGGLSDDEIAYLLDNDIDKVVAQLDKRIPWWKEIASSNRRAVLINMAFQMGIDGLLGFKNTLAMIKAGDYSGAAKGMLNSLWAKQTPARAHELSEQMRIG
jgi:lysozyme